MDMLDVAKSSSIRWDLETKQCHKLWIPQQMYNTCMIYIDIVIGESTHYSCGVRTSLVFIRAVQYHFDFEVNKRGRIYWCIDRRTQHTYIIRELSVWIDVDELIFSLEPADLLSNIYIYMWRAVEGVNGLCYYASSINSPLFSLGWSLQRTAVDNEEAPAAAGGVYFASFFPVFFSYLPSSIALRRPPLDDNACIRKLRVFTYICVCVGLNASRIGKSHLLRVLY